MEKSFAAIKSNGFDYAAMSVNQQVQTHFSTFQDRQKEFTHAKSSTRKSREESHLSVELSGGRASSCRKSAPKEQSVFPLSDKATNSATLAKPPSRVEIKPSQMSATFRGQQQHSNDIQKSLSTINVSTKPLHTSTPQIDSEMESGNSNNFGQNDTLLSIELSRSRSPSPELPSIFAKQSPTSVQPVSPEQPVPTSSATAAAASSPLESALSNNKENLPPREKRDRRGNLVQNYAAIHSGTTRAKQSPSAKVKSLPVPLVKVEPGLEPKQCIPMKKRKRNR